MMASSQVTKKLINSPESSVDDNLQGLAALHPRLCLHQPRRVVTRMFKQSDRGQVAVLSGGGSGHEPFSAGYVGSGMLGGSVAGGIFTSPPSSHILFAIKYLYQHYTGGVFIVIPNYTGDRLNFGKAIEKARNEGIKVESIMANEDLASANNRTGGRGMCGMVFLYKLCGAMGAENNDLEFMKNEASRILTSMCTFGVSLGACSLPGQPQLFEVAADEMVLGTGVHGEAGVEVRKLTTAKEVVQILASRIIDKMKLNSGHHVAVMLNNLGGTTVLEMNILANEVSQYFKSCKIAVDRLYSWHVMTSLEMPGFQLCVLKICSPDWLRWLESATEAPGWCGNACSLPVTDSDIIGRDVEEGFGKKLMTGARLVEKEVVIVKEALEKAAHALMTFEDTLNRLDAGCGDGDCGTTLKNLAHAVLSYLQSHSLKSMSAILIDLAEIAETEMGGTSGGIYSLGLEAAAAILNRNEIVSGEIWFEAWEAALNAIRKYGGADVGDRTMIDALSPGLKAFRDGLKQGGVKKALKYSLEAVLKGATSTANMGANAGRASYVGAEYLRGEDAGARGLAVWFQAVVQHLLTVL